MADGRTMGRVPVYFVLTPQFMMLDMAGPAEAFRVACAKGAPFDLHWVAPSEQVSSSLGLPVAGVSPLPSHLPEQALVMLCGVTQSIVNYALPEAQQVVNWLRATVGPQHQVASICSAALLLARAGLLNGRRCTTHFTLLERLRLQAPQARVEDDRIFVEDGSILTSAGVTAGIDLALYLIEQHAGPEIAQAVARHLVVYLRRSGQDPQLSPWLAHRNHMHPAVHKIQDVISGKPDRHWSLPELAEQVHMSVRNLTRLFRQHAGLGVVDYQQQIRVTFARQLLENPRHSVEKVAELAGFGSARDFRRVWAKFDPVPPGQRRQQLEVV